MMILFQSQIHKIPGTGKTRFFSKCFVHYICNLFSKSLWKLLQANKIGILDQKRCKYC